MRWVPKFVITGSEDPRELGIGVQDVELATGPGKARAPEARPPWAGAWAGCGRGAAPAERRQR